MNHLQRFLIISFSTSILSSTAFANSNNRDIYSECVEKMEHMNNSVVEVCSHQASTVYKKSINKNYKKTYQGLLKISPDDAKAFEQSQQAWLEYRNKYCQLAGQYVGSPMYVFCPAKLNQTRSAELQEMAGSF